LRLSGVDIEVKPAVALAGAGVKRYERELTGENNEEQRAYHL
jgi:hypothetical protein